MLLLMGGGAGLGYMLAYAQLHDAVNAIQEERRQQIARMEGLLLQVLNAVKSEDADTIAAEAAQISRQSCPVPPKKP